MPQAPVRSTYPTSHRFVPIACCLLFLATCAVLRGFVTDDSWISVRYAENLASGAGPVWNPGGPRVEGFSNPLLVLLEALAAAVGWDALSAAQVLGVTSGLGCVLLVTHAGRAVVGDGAAAVGGLLTAASAPFALWAVGGLETTLTAAVLTLGVLVVARPGGGRAAVAGAALAVLPWVRPEGLVVALAVAVLVEGPGLLRAVRRDPVTGARGPVRTAVRRVALVAGLPVLSQALLEVLRLSVYGHLMPNSVLYKSGTGDTFAVAAKFLEHSQVVLVLAGVGLLVVRRRALVLAVPALVYLAGSIGTLDSANSFSRFFMPVWPQVALLAGVGVAALARLLTRDRPAVHGRVLAALGVSAAAAASLVLPGSVPDVSGWQGGYMGCRAAARAEAAQWLVTSTPPGTLFAISDAGYVPARAGGRPAVDSFMLNDPLIQRTGPLSPSERADIVLERRPDVLLLASRTPDRFDPVYPTDRAISRHPDAAAYSLQHVAGGTAAGCRYHLLVLAR